MKIFDRLKGLVGRGGSEAEVVREVADEEFVPPNRAYARAVRNAQKRRGSGWTRPYRKGRKVRP